MTHVWVRRLVVGILVTLLFAVVTPALGRAATPVLPAGFVRVSTSSGQPGGELTDFAFVPDATGKLTRGFLSLGRAKAAVKYTDASGATRTLAVIPNVWSNGDYGLVGLSLSPDYLSTGEVALLATYAGSPHAVSRLDLMKVDDPLSPTTFTFVRTIIGGIVQGDGQPTADSHAAGTVLWASDGTLYAGFGDAASWTTVDPTALRALDPDDPHGKIFHIDVTGRGVPTNPYYGKAVPGSWRERVFASGFRNPYRFSADPTRLNALYVGDVGWATSEKVAMVTPGYVGGWPCYEGVDGRGGLRTSGYQDLDQCQDYYRTNRIDEPFTTTFKEYIAPPSPDLWTYSRLGRGAAIVGGVVYQGDSYPIEYRGAYFFANFPPDSPSKIWTLQTDGTKLTRAPESDGFATSIGGPVSLHVGPGGDIYYADYFTGDVVQIKYAPGNRPPDVLASTTTTPETKTVCVDSSASFDPDGDALTFSTDFGDGAVASGAKLCHAYPTAQATTTYAVVVSVRDSAGLTSTKSLRVAPADHPPTLTPVGVPAATARFAVGQPITVKLKVGDVEDGPVPVTEQTQMLHCASDTDCHTHFLDSVPLKPDSSGTVNYSTTFADHGQSTTQVLSFTTADSLGVQTTWTYQAKPALRTITVTSPAPVTINGYRTSTAKVAEGSNNSISVPATFDDLTFSEWSDGGSRTHSFTMPARDLNLTATFSSVIDRFNETLGGLLGAPTGVEVTVGAGRMRPYERGNIYWSAATGAHWVWEGNLARYLAFGGPAVLGFPTSDEIAIPGGARSDFQAGKIFWSPATGSHVLIGGILARYEQLGGPASIGFPQTDEVPVAGGARVTFERGSLLWSGPTGAHLIIGAIQAKFDAYGGPGALGFPTSDEVAVAGGARSTFTGGSIFWSGTTGAHVVIGGILSRYDQLGGPPGLGFPTTDEIALGGGARVSFERGAIIWSPGTGAKYVIGGILAKYDAYGGAARLGYPITDEVGVAGGARSTFTGGSVFWSGGTGAHVVIGAILAKYDQIGGPGSYIGFPTSDEFGVSGGAQTNFSYGHYIVWKPATGAVVH
jgi:uncharacterized protein with LGFP repeats/glucose/arabinose dehydrogenase